MDNSLRRLTAGPVIATTPWGQPTRIFCCIGN